ncbi:MAG TPA: site-specific integrase [Steroidobacteraceae bacterium]|nr:site-specific integrase [Steroidobacteraceae bacterium]
MASLISRAGRWRALVRKGGHTRCATFATRAAAKAWAATIERQVDELRASGVMQARGLTIGDLIDRYTRELYPVKAWGRSKDADLKRLKADLGDQRVSTLTSAHLTDHFRKRYAEGAGAVVVSSQLGYLVTVLRIARTLWHLDVPLQAALDARSALASVGMVGKSKRRDRRVSDAELAKLVGYFKKHQSAIPFPDVLQFCLASAMRISEVCRLEWRDLDIPGRTIIIRDRKHPTDKLGNDQTVPLLNVAGDAFAIIDRQPRGGARIFPYNSRTISTLVTRAARRANLHDLHLHDLRHEAISRLFEAGYRIEQVALVSGHRDWAMLKRYTHVRAADLHRPSRPEATPIAEARGKGSSVRA